MARTTTGTATRTTGKKKKTNEGAPLFALALGGNVGTVEVTLAAALRELARVLGPLEVASLYRTAAVSPLPQPPYLNTAAIGHTPLPPDAVLALAKELERAAGRTRSERHAPRPLDIDLLLYGDLVLRTPELTLPHPRLPRRRFVLAPLADLIPERRLPADRLTLAQRLAALPTEPAVEPVGWSTGEGYPRGSPDRSQDGSQPGS